MLRSKEAPTISAISHANLRPSRAAAAPIQHGSGDDGAAAGVAAAFTLRIEVVAMLAAAVADALIPDNASSADTSLAHAVHIRTPAFGSTVAVLALFPESLHAHETLPRALARRLVVTLLQ